MTKSTESMEEIFAKYRAAKKERDAACQHDPFEPKCTLRLPSVTNRVGVLLRCSVCGKNARFALPFDAFND